MSSLSEQRVKQLMIDTDAFCASKKVKLDWHKLVDSIDDYNQVYAVFIAVHVLDMVLASFRGGYSPVTIVYVLDASIAGRLLGAIEILKSEFTVNIGRYVLVDNSGGRQSFEAQKSMPASIADRLVFWYTDRPASKPQLIASACFMVDLSGLGVGDVIYPTKHKLSRESLSRESLNSTTRIRGPSSVQ